MSLSTSAQPSAATVLAPNDARPPDSRTRRLLRVGWNMVRAVLDQTAGRTFVRVCSSRSRFVRTVVFDAAQRSSQLELLLYTGGREHYVLNSRDDMICRSVFVYGGFDLAKLEQVVSLLRSRLGIERLETIIDVGANIGTICIPAVARGYANRAIAVEPHPVNCRILRTNVALNGLHDRISVFECACGADREGALEILRLGSNWGDVRVATESETQALPETQRYAVVSRRVDDLAAATVAGVTVLWIDTQGSEASVLQGAAGLLARRVPVVVEFDPALLARRPAGVEALAEALSGYCSFMDLEQPQRERPVVDIRCLAGEMSAAGRVFTDLLIL
jgi:FkbM family methyltransferase